MRNNTYKSFDAFKLGITKSFNGLMDVFPDFKFEITPKTIEINGKKAILIKGTYTLELRSGKEKVKLWIYAIPSNNQFYQINFMDSQNEDNSELFEKVINSLDIK